MSEPIRVALYGSSLFLTAIAASLEQIEGLILIRPSSDISIEEITDLCPKVIIWHRKNPPIGIPDALEAGNCFLEIDEEQSQVTIFRLTDPQLQSLPISEAADLIAIISDLITKEAGIVTVIPSE